MHYEATSSNTSFYDQSSYAMEVHHVLQAHNSKNKNLTTQESEKKRNKTKKGLPCPKEVHCTANISVFILYIIY